MAASIAGRNTTGFRTFVLRGVLLFIAWPTRYYTTYTNHYTNAGEYGRVHSSTLSLKPAYLCGILYFGEPP
jgi:hypothetical protein